jgi:hypothetical protein
MTAAAVLAAWTYTGRRALALVASDQYQTVGTAVPLTGIRAGDLVFWRNDRQEGPSVYHAGLYIGGGRLVEVTGDHVQTNTLSQWGPNDLMPLPPPVAPQVNLTLVSSMTFAAMARRVD